MKEGLLKREKVTQYYRRLIDNCEANFKSEFFHTLMLSFHHGFSSGFQPLRCLVLLIVNYLKCNLL